MYPLGPKGTTVVRGNAPLIGSVNRPSGKCDGIHPGKPEDGVYRDSGADFLPVSLMAATNSLDVIKAAMNRSKTDVSHLVELTEFLHHPLAQLGRRNLFVATLAQAGFDAFNGAFQGFSPTGRLRSAAISKEPLSLERS